MGVIKSAAGRFFKIISISTRIPQSTILIVDVEVAIRDMVAITLELAGFGVIVAANARGAHVSIIDQKPD